jgi:DNA-binding YbaB/EbfC family protein
VLPKGLGGLGNLGGMLKQAMEMKGKIEELKERLADERVEAAAGGGMVRVVMNGKFEIQSMSIEPEVVDANDVELLETLVISATNEGIRQVQELVKSKMTELTGGIEIPGLT